MKPAPFDLHRPEALDDVVALLAEHGDEAKPLAGGQSLVPLLALRLARYDHLVDLERVPAWRASRTPATRWRSGPWSASAPPSATTGWPAWPPWCGGPSR